MSTITIFGNFADTKNPHHRHINHILNRIKTGSSKQLVERIRVIGRKDLKNQLPCILFSGEFSQRNAKSIIKHSGFICLDFDKFPDSETLLTWKDTLEGDPYTYCVFLSPSGNGLKCVVKIPQDQDNHKFYFDALRDYYNCQFFDKNCSDICRICYESYDPYLTINQNSEVWFKKLEFKPVNIPSLSHLTHDKTAQNLLKWWNRKHGLYTGERNANLFKLCAAFNDYGVPKDYAFSLISEFQQPDFTISEIERVLNNGYKKTEKFGTLKF